MEKVKTATSKWVKTKGSSYRQFHGQRGYVVFSVSESQVEEVRRYIPRQEEHHRKMSFQDEFRALCAKHGIQIDERQAWDGCCLGWILFRPVEAWGVAWRAMVLGHCPRLAYCAASRLSTSTSQLGRHSGQAFRSAVPQLMIF